MNLDLYSRYALSSSVRILTSVKLRLAKSILCLGPRRSEIRALCLSRLAKDFLCASKSKSLRRRERGRSIQIIHSFPESLTLFFLYILTI